jgi:hypothetical protein
MLQSLLLAIVVLAALLVGVAIPVLLQLRSTLGVLEATLLRSSAHLDESLGAARAAAERLDAFVTRLQKGGQLDQFADGVEELGRTLGQLRDTVRVASAVGAAVGPAVAAAVRAFRPDPREPERSQPGPAPAAAVAGPPLQPENREQAKP